jgi:hypothetical protein
MLGRHGVGAFWPLWPGGCGKQARMTQSRSDVIGSRNLTGGAADAWRQRESSRQDRGQLAGGEARTG